jgi:hypothetical protein
VTPEEERIAAGHAREVLENVMFKAACKHIEAGLAAQRRKVPLRDTEMHTRLILTEQLWNNLLDYLGQAVDTGKFADFELERRRRALFGIRT